MNDKELRREEHLYVYVLGLMDDLIDENLVEGQKRLTPKGRELFNTLRENNFNPTEEEVQAVLQSFG